MLFTYHCWAACMRWYSLSHIHYGNGMFKISLKSVGSQLVLIQDSDFTLDIKWAPNIMESIFTFRLMLIYIYIFTFMHLADAFIQSDLHSSYSFTFYQLLLFLGIEPMILALLAPCSTIWATGKPVFI